MIIRELLKADLERTRMTQGDLAKRLGVSQQAVGLWIIRNRIPARQVSDLMAIFGQESAVASAFQQGLLDGRSTHTRDHRVPDHRVPDHRVPDHRVPNRIAEVNRFDHIMQLREAEREMVAMLMMELPGIHFETWLETGSYKRRFDYVTDHLVVEVAVLSAQQINIPFYDYRRVSYKIQDLAVTRTLYPKRHYVLIVVIQDETEASETAMNRIRYDCLALGIKALRVKTHLDAAQLIIEMERPEMDLPQGEYDDRP